MLALRQITSRSSPNLMDFFVLLGRFECNKLKFFPKETFCCSLYDYKCLPITTYFGPVVYVLVYRSFENIPGNLYVPEKMHSVQSSATKNHRQVTLHPESTGEIHLTSGEKEHSIGKANTRKSIPC